MYVVGVTEPQSEPTNADLLAFMQQFSTHVMTELAKTNAKIDGVDEKVAALDSKVDALDTKTDSVQTEMREGFAGLKGETALLERYVLGVQRAVTDHLNDPDNHHRHAA